MRCTICTCSEFYLFLLARQCSVYLTCLFQVHLVVCYVSSKFSCCVEIWSVHLLALVNILIFRVWKKTWQQYHWNIENCSMHLSKLDSSYRVYWKVKALPVSPESMRIPNHPDLAFFLTDALYIRFFHPIFQSIWNRGYLWTHCKYMRRENQKLNATANIINRTKFPTGQNARRCRCGRINDHQGLQSHFKPAVKMLTRVTVKSCSSFCLDRAVFTCKHSHTVDVLHVPVHMHMKKV